MRGFNQPSRNLAISRDDLRFVPFGENLFAVPIRALWE